jgi:hypothetical protein
MSKQVMHIVIFQEAADWKNTTWHFIREKVEGTTYLS